MTRPTPHPRPAPPPSFSDHPLALLFAAAVTAALFSRTWAKVLFFRDLVRWSYPGISFFKQSLLSGELPLWNPYLFCGYPFLAEMANAVLYPLSLLLLPFPAPLALKVYPAVHYFLTGCLMWRLLREWRLNQAAALFGALVWMASGYLVSMHLNFNYLIPAAWYPGLLFAGHRLLQTRRLGWLIATGLFWAMIFLGGDPQAFLFAGVLLLLYAGLTLDRETSPLPQALPLLALAGALGSLLVLAQLLPSLEFGAWCTKLKGYSFSEATQWSHHPLRLLEWIWPGLWGPQFPPTHFWGRFLRNYSATLWSGTVYLGLFPLWLAARECRFYREKTIRFLVFTLVLFFLLALGYYSPLYRLVWAALPPYRIFRFPEKHLAVVTFALAGLAAFGFQRLLALEPEAPRRSFFRNWALFTAFLAIALAGGFLVSRPLARTLAVSLSRTYRFEVTAELVRASLLRALVRPPGVALAFLLLWLGSQRLKPLRRWLAPSLILATAVDLLALGQSSFEATAPYLYDFEPAAVRLIRQAQAGAKEPIRLYRAGKLLIPTPLAEPVGLSEDEKQVFWTRDTLLSNLAAPEGLEDIFGYDPAVLLRNARFQERPLRIKPLQMLNVKYLLDGIEFGEVPQMPELEVAGQDDDRNLLVLRNRDYFPRAFFVDGVRPARDAAEALDLLFTTDLRRQVILERSDAGARPGDTFLAARSLIHRNREAAVELTNPKAGYLVLSDSYLPGWQARVDGKPVRIFCANYLVRAVALGPGNHRVEFTYRPWPWRVGATVSLCSLFLLPLALLLRRRFAAPGQP